MKRLAIFCDGTWNAPTGLHETHVERLARSVRRTDRNGVAQVALYYPGVGEGRGPTWLNRTMDRMLGGAFGLGLIDNIAVAFRDIILNYAPGDEIFIFGFSRGAYTARSLAGLLRTAGIPEPRALGAIGTAIAEYMRRGTDTHPDAERVRRFRADLSPGVATSPEDAIWRLSQGYRAPEQLKIDYMGLWDTVGGLGLPGVLGLAARLYNQRYSFHDTDLSRSVRAARHAVAIDERRRLFPPTLWGNLDDLNGGTTGTERPYQQQWFPGTHSVVGGSGLVPSMSAYSFLWVVEGAMEKGLSIDTDELDLQKTMRRADGSPEGFVQKGILGALPGLSGDRDGPASVSDISGAARARVKAVPSYRPKTLSQVIDLL